MKKIIALFVLLFAFTFNANAQDRSNAADLAKQDTQEIAQYLGLQGEVLVDLQTVFKEKHEVLLTEGLSEDRKVILSNFVETKLSSLLSQGDLDKLKADTALYKKLTRN
ncbi:hypothetical protein [uncultured Flavobacterium sp.]|uniref:hypothetical protein n=1 Tax=uncultured Flavobacterium sp. TaxID=165435 RepID=UPI0030C848AD